MLVLYDTLYRSDRYGETGLDEFLPPLVAQIIGTFPSGASIRTDLQVDHVALTPELMSTIGIIVNELITNSMKYAFPAGGNTRGGAGEAGGFGTGGSRAGTIRLSAAQNGSTLSISYRDDGPGLPEGVDFEHSTGFGLRLVGMLAQQIGGTVRMDKPRGNDVSSGMNCTIEVGL